MPELTVEVETTVAFDVYCSGCGKGICHLVDVDDRRKRIHVEPCEKCLEDAKEEGRREQQ